MNPLRPAWQRGLLILLAASFPVISGSADAGQKEMYKPKQAVPGGLSPRPYIYSITPGDGTVTLEWQGLTPPYRVQGSTSAAHPIWQNLGGEVAGESLTVPADSPMAVFRVDAGIPYFAGANVCRACHRDAHQDWSQTRHARALETLKRIGMDGNSRCLECHTVGRGLPTGFISTAQTPHLGGVQCENCHGPGGAHLSNVFDPSLQPKVTLAAETCGGCHTDAHHPTYDEWLGSRHAQMDPSLGSGFIEQGESRMRSCGACHSGAVRLAMLSHWKALQTNPDAQLVYPTRTDAAHFTTECAVCHEPHRDTAAHQLRNPTFSTQHFSYSTGAAFADQYNPDVQLCAQCHNMRGATWNSGARPPHYSPQYNLLIGTGGVDPEGGQMLRTHGGSIQEQCAHCHTHAHPEAAPTLDNPNYTGHTFRPTFTGCVECHGSTEVAALLAQGTQRATKSRIAEVKALLDEWGMSRAPEPLRTKYGRRAWEFTSPGILSSSDGPPGSGPSAEEQRLIPEGIQKARFNLYLVEHDGSYGVHNGQYARHLLRIATDFVHAELANP